jgi:hypothetical protein
VAGVLMRGRGRKRKPPPRSSTGAATDAREAVERKWFSRMQRDDDLAALVTGEQLASEPFHRWLTLRQAFAPELVRQFLSEAQGLSAEESLLLLDPFAGSGTFVIECARQGVEAVGFEALESLAFLARARGAQDIGALPDLSGCESWEQVAPRLETEVHRAALICAVARRHTSEGTLNRNAPRLLHVLADVAQTIAEDLRQPLSRVPQVRQGDARRLDTVEDASIGGILTSPPYLSRHDYTRVTRPHETVYRYWYPGRDLARRRADQVRAHPRAYARPWAKRMPAAVTEACEALEHVNQTKLAGVVRSYFEDVFTALAECSRALAAGCPCWVVVGGARLKDIYVPSDTILADFAKTCGFAVAGIRVARRLIAAGRRFGGLSDVSPRESILMLQKS